MRRCICLNLKALRVLNFLVMSVNCKNQFMNLNKFQELGLIIYLMPYMKWALQNQELILLFFFNFTNASPIYLLVYVDDIIITGGNETGIQLLIDTLNSTFSLNIQVFFITSYELKFLIFLIKTFFSLNINIYDSFLSKPK